MSNNDFSFPGNYTVTNLEKFKVFYHSRNEVFKIQLKLLSYSTENTVFPKKITLILES